MAKIVLGYGGDTFIGTDRFFPPASGDCSAITPETRVRWAVEASTISKLGIVILGYPSGNNATIRLRKNGVNTSLAVAVAGGATGYFQNLTDSVDYATGDYATIHVTTGALVNIGTIAVGQDFTGPGPTPVRYAIGQSVATTSAVSQYYSAIGRTISLFTTEAPTIRFAFQAAGQIEDLLVDVTDNGKTAPIAFRAVVDGVDTGPTLTIPAGATGSFILPGVLASLAAGERIAFVARFSTGGIFRFRHAQYTFRTASDVIEYSVNPYQSSSTGGASRYLPVYGGYGNVRSVDWNADCLVPFDTTVQGFRAQVSTANQAIDVILQLNGVDTAMKMTVPVGGGNIASTGGPIAVSTGDIIRYRLTPHAALIQFEALTIALSSGAPPPGIDVPPGELTVSGYAPALILGQQVAPTEGGVVFSGYAPVLSEFSGVRPVPGALAVAGAAPLLQFDADVAPLAGSLRIAGAVPQVLVGIAVAPPSGALTIAGGAPGVFTEFAVPASQLAGLVLAAPEPPPGRASQLAALALAEPPAPPARASQTALLAIGEIVPDVQASQLAVLVLGHGSACVTEKCQIWTIRRRDGRVFRYTSHDRPVRYNGKLYASCRSLNPSASENASTLGSVGNMELVGLIDDDGISEADLYGGLFDDAYVTVDLIVWGQGSDVPRRLAAGWTGSLQQGETSFNMEVLGAGARIEQQALVQMLTPGCRWVFGSKECGVDVEAMKIAGTVAAAKTRGVFRADLPSSPPGRQWASGRVRFISGRNAGQAVEIKSVDFASGEVVTWVSPGFLPEPGDAIELLPGCDLSRDGGCTLYQNVINFGGFPDVPGSDALLETPDARY